MSKENAQKTFGTLKGFSILIVDDEKLNQLVVQNMAKLWGADFQAASSGAEALKKIKESKFNVILMDLLMPGIDGYRASEIIRQDHKNIPIIAISGTTTEATIEKIYKAGMNDYITKPFKIDELHEKISKYLLMDSRDSNEDEGDDNIDLTYLRESTDSNSEMMRQIIEVFLRQTPAYVQRLEAALENKDWNDLKKISHKMKPTFEYVGITNLKTLAAQIESDAENGVNLESIPDQVKNLKKKCEKAISQLQVELSKI